MTNRIYCQRCRRSLSVRAFNLERWQNLSYRICEACIQRLQDQGATMSEATQVESESMIQIIMQERLGGECEVETPVGFVDLLTDEEVIEIKHVRNWKDATKVLVYAIYFPNRKPRIHLFGGYTAEVRALVENTCRKLGITVTWERDPF